MELAPTSDINMLGYGTGDQRRTFSMTNGISVADLRTTYDGRCGGAKTGPFQEVSQTFHELEWTTRSPGLLMGLVSSSNVGDSGGKPL